MNLTLTSKLMIGAGGVSLASMLAMIGYVTAAMHAMSDDLVRQRMDQTVRLTALVLTDAVIATDMARIDDVTGTILRSDFGVQRMCVFDRQDRRLSTARCAQVDDSPLPGSVVTEAPVIVSGAPFGSVGLGYDPTMLAPSLTRIEQHLFLIGTGATLLVIGMTSAIGAVFQVELRALGTAFDAMAKTGTLRQLRRTPVQELARITDSFNNLLTTCKGHDHDPPV